MKVYQNATLVTVNAGNDVIACGTLAVENGRIVYAGPYKTFENAAVIDCTDKIIMPGFVNGHSHMPMSFFRGYADDVRLQEWLTDCVNPMEVKHTPETLFTGALLACLEYTRTGTTTVNDMYIDGDIMARAFKTAGLSGIVCNCLIGDGSFGSPDKALQVALELAAKYRNDPVIRTAIAPHAEYTATTAQLEKWGRAALDSRQPIHIHCSETRFEHEECIKRHGVTPTALFEKLGMMEVPMYMAHCVWLSDEDMDIIKRNGATVLHNPCSNLKLGSGIARVPLMLEKGLNISLSTDGPASNNSLDLWEEMRFAALIHKGNTLDATAVNASQALYMATKGSARALGYTDRGSLEAGLRADFIVVGTDQAVYHPVTDVIHQIVYGGNSRDIEMTVAGGEVIYDHGDYLRLDKKKIFADAQQYFDTIFKK